MTNDPMPTSPPPGKPGYYYPDKRGGALKWWDGVGWTEYAPTQQLPPQPVQPPPQPPKKKGWLRMGILLGILGIAGCGAMINAIGGGGDPAATTAQATPADTEPADETTEDEPEPEPTQETVKVGEKVRDGGYQFTVTNVKCGVKRIGSTYANEKAQGQFCLVKMRVKNVGKEPINFSDENQALVDTKGREYSPDDGAWIYLDDAEIYAEINPGNTLKTTVPFDISKRTKPDYLLLKAGVWGFSEGVRVKL